MHVIVRRRIKTKQRNENGERERERYDFFFVRELIPIKYGRVISIGITKK